MYLKKQCNKSIECSFTFYCVSAISLQAVKLCTYINIYAKYKKLQRGRLAM